MTKKYIKMIAIILTLILMLTNIPYAKSSSYNYVDVIELSHQDFENERKIKPIYDFLFHPRAFLRVMDYETYKEYKIYINKDAFFLNERDKELLIKHEYGHIEGKDDTLIGVMSFSGIIRYFTIN